ncbi:iron complex transport system ATP-binding protein [Azospirillum agricola]|uniref:heme ABC transporter ATP-binding protein n=1 Tax=Azospirillum agricola TaxID=1720247 RepID=UPI001AEA8DCF|nr:heme ABC transporter ATP-binding protein [Azospirillum agricola]MBP2227859.1 iron complex transport system ATP-binding protein [Azospirillum agricola]
MIEARGIDVRQGRRRVLHGVDATVRAGRVLALLGPNGAGKSTLLAAMAGDLRPSAGSLTFEGRPLAAWSPRDLARRRAVLPQHATAAADFLVEEVVALGRLPFARSAEALDDRDAVAAVLRDSGADSLAGRRYGALSGGERQRVQWARLLAQLWSRAPRPAAVLLDEPTAAMDMVHQTGVLRQAAALARRGLAVAVVLHDVNAAALHADDALLLRDGRVVGAGPVGGLLQPGPLADCFGVPVERLTRADGRPAFVVG